MSNYIAYQLKQSDLFADLPLEALEALGESMRRESRAKGDVIFRQNDLGDSMYVILRGKVRIYSETNPDLTYKHYGASEIFGEFSLIDNQPRSASAAVEEDCELLILSRDTLMGFFKSHPEASLAMMRTLSERARYTTQYLEAVVVWTKRMAEGQYSEVQLELQKATGASGQLGALVANFLQMIQSIHKREETLREELVRLRVGMKPEAQEQSRQRLEETPFFPALAQRLSPPADDPNQAGEAP